jgi:hypothetical protein
VIELCPVQLKCHCVFDSFKLMKLSRGNLCKLSCCQHSFIHQIIVIFPNTDNQAARFNKESIPLVPVSVFATGSTGVGFTIAQAVERMAERVPLPETKFFAIVINIQQKAGGNLTEALGNLSQVLRSRQTLQLKIKALSSEARASAWILGLMPFIIGGLVYLTAPTYLEPLWTTQIGQLVLTGVAIWMSMGVLTMRAMLNFKP